MGTLFKARGCGLNQNQNLCSSMRELVQKNGKSRSTDPLALWPTAFMASLSNLLAFVGMEALID